MVDVGIRALKQNASAVVADAARGETVTISDRGRPVARMTAIPVSPLDGLLAAGQARPPRRAMADLPRPLPAPPGDPSLTDALLAARDGERF